MYTQSYLKFEFSLASVIMETHPHTNTHSHVIRETLFKMITRNKIQLYIMHIKNTQIGPPTSGRKKQKTRERGRGGKRVCVYARERVCVRMHGSVCVLGLRKLPPPHANVIPALKLLQFRQMREQCIRSTDKLQAQPPAPQASCATSLSATIADSPQGTKINSLRCSINPVSQPSEELGTTHTHTHTAGWAECFYTHVMLAQQTETHWGKKNSEQKQRNKQHLLVGGFQCLVNRIGSSQDDNNNNKKEKIPLQKRGKNLNVALKKICIHILFLSFPPSFF